MDLALDVRPASPEPRARRHRHPHRLRNALLVTTAVGAAAAVGSAGARPDSAWSRSLDKPSWYPPASTFPVVWTVLYGTIAWSATRALDRAPAGRRGPVVRSLATNLALNGGWTWSFFRAQRPGLAVAEAAALTVSTASLVRTVARHDRVAGAALVPYLGWTVFATALTEAIWFRNTP